MKSKSVLLLVGACVVASATALVARALMRPPPPVTIIKEVEVSKPVVRRVLVARQSLQPGSFVDAGIFDWGERPDEALHAGFFSASGEDAQRDLTRSLAGAALRRPLSTGDVLSRDMLVRPGEPSFIAAVPSPGMRAISIPTSAVSSNAGLVSAGDWVDVILSLERGSSADTVAGAESQNPLTSLAAQTILQRVRVLALNNNAESIAPVQGEDAAGKSGKSRVATRTSFETLTLEVTPEAAEKLAVAKEVGTLQVALRGVRDELAEAPSSARQVTRISDATAIFKAQTGSVASVSVKTFQGAQQAVLSFNRAP